ncbi:hypothetical protein BHM03_00009963, partial [Ensete ventricosum]
LKYMSKLKFHEKRLLKKVNFIEYKREGGHREALVTRRYHLSERDDYKKYPVLVPSQFLQQALFFRNAIPIDTTSTKWYVLIRQLTGTRTAHYLAVSDFDSDRFRAVAVEGGRKKKREKKKREKKNLEFGLLKNPAGPGAWSLVFLRSCCDSGKHPEIPAYRQITLAHEKSPEKTREERVWGECSQMWGQC